MPNRSASTRVPVPRHPLLAAILSLALIIALPRPVQAAQPSSKHPSPVASVIALAHKLIGAPYAYIGDDPKTGFSCIGFVHYLYLQVGIDVPYELHSAYAASPHVDESHLQPGDLVFFKDTVWSGLSHVGLYIGAGEVIGADNYATGVEQTRLADSYWHAHYMGATRPLAGTVKVPITPPIVQPVPQPIRLRAGDRLRAPAAGAVYSGPGYGYPRIDQMTARTTFAIVRVQGGWANVVYHTPGTDYYGWLDQPYLAACARVT